MSTNPGIQALHTPSAAFAPCNPADSCCRLLTLLLLCLQPLLATPASARDWYSAGHGLVDTRAFIVQADEQQVRTLLPSPLALNSDFPGKVAGKHPLIVLFSNVMPRKAHLMPILIDIPYCEFAVFVPEVTHPELNGVFIHSTILYLDSRSAVWIGQWPYRFPKVFARVDRNEGTGIGQWTIRDDDAKAPVIRFDYTLTESDEETEAQAVMKQLDDWFSLPLINWRNGKFACSNMDWEINLAAPLQRVQGTLQWRDDWLADRRRLPAFAEELRGWRLETRWYLSMPFDCRRYAKTEVESADKQPGTADQDY